MTTRVSRKVGWIIIAALAWVLSLSAAASAQTNIILRPSATLDGTRNDAESSARSITLGDVADLDPPTTAEATRLAEIPIVAAPDSGNVNVSIADVRRALDAATVNWGRITLRGSSCKVSLNDPAPAAPTRPATPPQPARTGLSQATPQPIDLDETPTIRTAIAARLVALYGVEAQDLRLAFDPADEAFLSQPIDASRIDVQPGSTGTSARTPVSVYMYQGDRLTTVRLVATQALINREVVSARSPITRGQAITQDQVEAGRQWQAPNAKPSAQPEAVVGQIAARAIGAGAVISAADVTPAVLCKRGDVVWVHVLAGPFTVKAKCRAMAQGRDGEQVQLKLDGSDRVFSARMSGPGRAVMLTDTAAPAQP